MPKNTNQTSTDETKTREGFKSKLERFAAMPHPTDPADAENLIAELSPLKREYSPLIKKVDALFSACIACSAGISPQG